MGNRARIGIGIGSGDVFWVQVNEAIHRRCLEHSVELVPIFRSSFFAALTEDERTALLEEIASQELDALVGWSFPESLSYAVLEMGVPIVHVFETVVEHPLCISPIGLQTIAEQLAHHLAGLMDYRGNVLVVGGLLREDLPDDGRSRVAGIQNALRDYPDIRFDHIPSEWSEEQADPQVRAQLQNWPHSVDAIFGLSDSMALVGRRVALELDLCDESVPVVGINGDPEGLAAVIEGRMAATMETPATSLAHQAVDIALKIISGQPYPAHYPYNARLITADNVAKVATEKLVAIANIPGHLVNFERSTQQEYLDYLETSLDISRQIGSVLDYEHLPVELARLIRTNYGYDHVQLFYWSEREQTLTLADSGADSKPTTRIPLLSASVLSEALIGDRPIFIPDSHHSIRFAPDAEWPNTRSRVVLPIRQGGKVLGLLDLHAFRVMQCTRQHLLGLQSLADQIGVAIRNTQLYSDALQAKLMAEKADQLKTRLLANVSHELRNPLHIILSHVERLEIHTQSGDEPQQIQTNALHLLRLINDLVDLSRAEIDELSIAPEVIEPVSFLTDVFESIADTTYTHTEKSMENAVCWQLQLPDRLPLIQADPDRLRQILLNLLSNAKKFTNEGRIVLGAEVVAPHFHVWVQDSGIGIPAPQQQSIFEPFATVHNHANHTKRKDGMGLGLSIARRLVALHGGTMTVESRVDRGTAFHVYLPLPNLVNMPTLSIEHVEPILLVVSSRANLSPDLLAYAEMEQLEPVPIGSVDALDAVLSRGLPSAIAWDARVAGEGEWDVVQRLHSHPQLCHLPFLFYGHRTDEEATGEANVTSVLLKPVKQKTLLGMINSMVPPNDAGFVLIVDDDLEALSLYQTLLSAQFPAYTCRTAPDGKAALAIMKTSVPGLVVLDLMMPEMDGFEVIQWMRENRRTQAVPIVILSGKILTLEDIRRLEPYQKIMFQSKDVLSDDELAQSLQQGLFDNPALPPQTSAVVKHAIVYIQQHYAEALSRPDIAQAVGVSENYLTHIFHQELGVSLWDYLNRYRVLQAKDLLQRTGESIASISAAVGFDDPAYFSRVFRRYVGHSPRVYRNTPTPETR